MPVMGLLTTAALVVAFLFTSATPQVASAAEILERAAKARAEFKGWYTLEVRRPETGAWHVVQRVNLAEGKWFERDSDAPEQYGKTLHDAAWAYGNEREPVLVEYRADTRTATVQGYSSDSYSWSDLPINETQLREWIEAEGMYESLPQVTPDGVLRIDLVKRSAKPDAEGQIDPAYENWPVRIEMTFTQKRGLLSGIAVQQSADDTMAQWARITYGTAPIERWEDLIDETVEVRDLRPDASTRAWIDRIDAVWRGGLGFDTAILVKRTGDPIKGTLNERGWVTLYAERGDGAYAKFEWKRGQDIAGWPEPTLDAVVSHLEIAAPDVVLVTDGATLWWRWGAEEAWNDKPLTDGGVSGVAASGRLVGEIWPSLDEIFYDPGHKGVQPITRRDPERSNGVILEAVSMAHWQGTPADQVTPQAKRTVLFLEDLGPLPLENTYEQYGQDGGLWARTRVVFSLGDLEMHRPPVRVPLYWRSTRESPRNETLPEFNHLLPQPDRQLDAKWFGDPTGRWPRVESEAAEP